MKDRLRTIKHNTLSSSTLVQLQDVGQKYEWGWKERESFDPCGIPVA